MESCLPGDRRRVTPVLRQLHSQDVVVTHIQGLLLREERQHLLEASAHSFRPSTVVTQSGEEAVVSGRTSHSAFLAKGSDPVIDCLGERLATMAQQPIAHLEPLQLTKYRKTQEYRPHHDYLGVAEGDSERTTTVFAYLQSDGCTERDRCGGATVFPELTTDDGEALRVYPSAGDAVMWSNRTAGGGLNSSTLHGGERIECEGSQKVGLNAWFRDRPWVG